MSSETVFDFEDMYNPEQYQKFSKLNSCITSNMKTIYEPMQAEDQLGSLTFNQNMQSFRQSNGSEFDNRVPPPGDMKLLT